MTKVSKKPIYSALENSKPVQNPDLVKLADKNYTSTILRYSNLAILYSQLNTESKTIVGAINELKKDVPYVLPPATTETLGGIIVGENLTITPEGVLSSQAGGDTYYSGVLTTIDTENKINVNMTKSTPADIEQESIENPNVLFFTEGTPGGDGSNITTTTATLLSGSWSALQQTISISDITTRSAVLVSPTPTYIETYALYGIYAISQGNGTLTFRCSETPSINIVVNIAYWESAS